MKLLRILLLTIALLPAVWGQGQVTFSNFSPAEGVNSRAVWQGTTTGVTSPPHWAQLILVNGTSETPVGNPVAFRPQAAAAGYVIPTVMTIEGIPIGSQASFRMVVMFGNVYSENAVWGRSSVSTVTLGGGTITPPSLLGLTDISGVQNIQFVPEPGVMALSLGGLLGFGCLRRKLSRNRAQP